MNLKLKLVGNSDHDPLLSCLETIVAGKTGRDDLRWRPQLSASCQRPGLLARIAGVREWQQHISSWAIDANG
jgi:hypothetical protein